MVIILETTGELKINLPDQTAPLLKNSRKSETALQQFSTKQNEAANNLGLRVWTQKHEGGHFGHSALNQGPGNITAARL